MNQSLGRSQNQFITLSFFFVVAASMERYVNLTCALCGENLYTDLCDFVEAAGSQPHLDRYLEPRSKNSSFHGVSWFP